MTNNRVLAHELVEARDKLDILLYKASQRIRILTNHIPNINLDEEKELIVLSVLVMDIHACIAEDGVNNMDLNHIHAFIKDMIKDAPEHEDGCGAFIKKAKHRLEYIEQKYIKVRQ